MRSRLLLVILCVSAAGGLAWFAGSRADGSRPGEETGVRTRSAERAPGRVAATPRTRPKLPPELLERPRVSQSTARAPDSPAGDGDPGVRLGVHPDDRSQQAWAVAMSQRQLAYRAYRQGSYEGALAYARAVIAVRPNDEQSHRLAALSACHLGRAEIAQEHANMLDRHRFERVQHLCKAKGISLLHPYDPEPPDPGPDEQIGASQIDDPGPD